MPEIRFRALDSFRGIAAVLVFLFHLSYFLKSPFLSNDFIFNSNLFVDFFFVLSGFVIANSYNEKFYNWTSFKTFLTKRFYRIYPLHIFLLLVFLAYVLLRIALNMEIKNSNNYSGIGFVSNLLLLNSIKWHPNILDLSWNAQSWSISAEFLSYLVFGIICTLFQKNKKNIILFSGLLIVTAFILLYQMSNSFIFTYTFELGFLRGLLGFNIGYFIFIIYKKYHGYLKDFSFVFFTIAELLVIITLAASISYSPSIIKNYGFCYYMIFGCLIFIFTFESGWISRYLIVNPFFEHLGNISYSFYMTHGFCILIFSIVYKKLRNHFDVFSQPNMILETLIILFLFVIVMIISNFTYKKIELRFKSGLSNA